MNRRAAALVLSVVTMLGAACGPGPTPGEAAPPADAGAGATTPADAGAPGPTACGATTCVPGEWCVRRFSGVDAGTGGPSPDHCAAGPAEAPSCGDAWSNAACRPTACFRLLEPADGGHFVDCWGQ